MLKTKWRLRKASRLWASTLYRASKYPGLKEILWTAAKNGSDNLWKLNDLQRIKILMRIHSPNIFYIFHTLMISWELAEHGPSFWKYKIPFKARTFCSNVSDTIPRWFIQFWKKCANYCCYRNFLINQMGHTILVGV